MRAAASSLVAAYPLQNNRLTIAHGTHLIVRDCLRSVGRQSITVYGNVLACLLIGFPSSILMAKFTDWGLWGLWSCMVSEP